MAIEKIYVEHMTNTVAAYVIDSKNKKIDILFAYVTYQFAKSDYTFRHYKAYCWVAPYIFNIISILLTFGQILSLWNL